MNINEIRGLISARRAELIELYMAGDYKTITQEEFFGLDLLLKKRLKQFEAIAKRTKKALK